MQIMKSFSIIATLLIAIQLAAAKELRRLRGNSRNDFILEVLEPAQSKGNTDGLMGHLFQGRLTNTHTTSEEKEILTRLLQDGSMSMR